MDAKTQAAIIAAAVDHYGQIHQMLKAVEEAGELQRAIARMIAAEMEGNGDDQELIVNLIEETADVWIMANQMTYIMGVDAVREETERKLRRLAERMGMDIGEDAP